MIVVDTSAVIALLNRELEAEAVARVMAGAGVLVLCSGTYAELVMVAGRRGQQSALLALEERLGDRWQVQPLTRSRARRVGELHQQYGRGAHPARLNFGDCFALALCEQLDRPLLYIGHDFAQVPDLLSVWGPPSN